MYMHTKHFVQDNSVNSRWQFRLTSYHQNRHFTTLHRNHYILQDRLHRLFHFLKRCNKIPVCTCILLELHFPHSSLYMSYNFLHQVLNMQRIVCCTKYKRLLQHWHYCRTTHRGIHILRENQLERLVHNMALIANLEWLINHLRSLGCNSYCMWY